MLPPYMLAAGVIVSLVFMLGRGDVPLREGWFGSYIQKQPRLLESFRRSACIDVHVRLGIGLGKWARKSTGRDLRPVVLGRRHILLAAGH